MRKAPIDFVYKLQNQFAYWYEMARNAIKSDFRTSKTAEAILWKNLRIMTVEYWSEMARSAIESDFRASKMATGGHFVKTMKVAHWSTMTRNKIESDSRASKIKLRIDLKWLEMRSKAIFTQGKG